MKRRDFTKLALAGLSTGILVSGQLSAAPASKASTSSKAVASADKSSSSQNKASDKSSDDNDPNAGNMNYHVMTEDELMLQLSPDGIAMYKSLDAKGKQLALLVASSMCDHTNECKGLNACQTEDHTCAGKGNCKGQGKCAFSDKNLAVKLVRDKMAAKRANASTPSTNSTPRHNSY